jgi:coenzyme F420-reducing hydrogenase delta subunit
MRLEYPTNIKIVRVPCTGKVDVIHLLRAFEKGADGAYVVGCLEGSCQYNNGNFRARKRVAQVGEVLESIGIEKERVRMYNLSSGEGTLFAEFANEMYGIICDLGENPIKKAKKKMDAA